MLWSNFAQQVRMEWVKRTDRPRYRALKHEFRRAPLLKAMADFASTTALPYGLTPSHPTFKHSGNAGDIIYALPTVRALAGEHGASLQLALDVPNRFPHGNHPCGAVKLTDWMYRMLEPLLASQPYLRELVRHGGEPVDYDLDLFHASRMPLERLGISRWYFYITGVAPDLSLPWLQAAPDPRSAGRILLSRSCRYRNHALDYGILKGLSPIFLGVEEEYKDMRQTIPGLEWLPVTDFLQAAQLIAGCRLFIGNQSLLYALAEGLKVPRVLELDPSTPNVVPTGGVAFDVLFQKQFEHIIARLAGGLEGQG